VSSFTYSGDPSSSDKDAVRFEISDTNPSSPLLQDGEVDWAILSETGTAAGAPTTLSTGNIYRSAARCMETLSRLFAAQADTQLGSLKLTYSQQAGTYAERAAELRAKAQGMNAPYAGGQSLSEKQAAEQDTDAVPPLFTRKEWSNPWTGAVRGFDAEDFGPPVG
jgi:hypothetical protein